MQLSQCNCQLCLLFCRQRGPLVCELTCFVIKSFDVPIVWNLLVNKLHILQIYYVETLELAFWESVTEILSTGLLLDGESAA